MKEKNSVSRRKFLKGAGLVALGMSGFWTELIYGLIIVLSVVIQTVVGRRIK